MHKIIILTLDLCTPSHLSLNIFEDIKNQSPILSCILFPVYFKAITDAFLGNRSDALFFNLICLFIYFYTAGSYSLSILYILVYICQSQSPIHHSFNDVL